MNSNPYAHLGELLLEEGKIRETDLERALEDKGVELIGDALINNNACTEDDVLDALSKQLGIWRVRLAELVINPSIISKLKAKVAHHYRVVPLYYRGPALVVATANPQDHEKLEELKVLLGCVVKPMLCSKAEIGAALERYYGAGGDSRHSGLGSTRPLAVELAALSEGDSVDNADDGPVVKFVNSILLEAYRHRATDVHLEPTDSDVDIRMRIDGVLTTVHSPPAIRSFKSAIVQRFRSMAGLPAAESGCGRLKARIGDDTFDLRISILPSIHGETVSIRLHASIDFRQLPGTGLSEHNCGVLHSALVRPHGLILFAGLRGSGTSTTLYGALEYLRSDRLKIITIEDPVELPLEGVTQMQVGSDGGMTIAGGFHSMLSHDPDVMVAGDIVDSATARAVVDASLSGHLVLAAIHAGDVATAIGRLRIAGIDPHALACAIECVVVQCLVRTLCEECKAKKRPELDLTGSSWPKGVKTPRKVYEAKGCSACNQAGYSGRTGLFQVVRFNAEMRHAVAVGTDPRVIQELAVERGMKTLLEDGMARVIGGVTTVDDVIRATHWDGPDG